MRSAGRWVRYYVMSVDPIGACFPFPFHLSVASRILTGFIPLIHAVDIFAEESRYFMQQFPFISCTKTCGVE